MNPEAPIETFRLSGDTAVAQGVPQPMPSVTVESPAIAVMTDLTMVRAVTIVQSIGLRQAEQVMIHQGVRLLFVLTDMQSIEGLITSTDLGGDRPLQLVNQRHVHFDELTVGDIMTPVSRLDAIDLDLMHAASVGNLIATLQRFGRNHLLVVEKTDDGTRRRIRGVISRAQIERQLGKPIAITHVASSFSEIERALS